MLIFRHSDTPLLRTDTLKKKKIEIVYLFFLKKMNFAAVMYD